MQIRIHIHMPFPFILLTKLNSISQTRFMLAHAPIGGLYMHFVFLFSLSIKRSDQ